MRSQSTVMYGALLYVCVKSGLYSAYDIVVMLDKRIPRAVQDSSIGTLVVI